MPPLSSARKITVNTNNMVRRVKFPLKLLSLTNARETSATTCIIVKREFNSQQSYHCRVAGVKFSAKPNTTGKHVFTSRLNCQRRQQNRERPGVSFGHLGQVYHLIIPFYEVEWIPAGHPWPMLADKHHLGLRRFAWFPVRTCCGLWGILGDRRTRESAPWRPPCWFALRRSMRLWSSETNGQEGQNFPGKMTKNKD